MGETENWQSRAARQIAEIEDDFILRILPESGRGVLAFRKGGFCALSILPDDDVQAVLDRHGLSAVRFGELEDLRPEADRLNEVYGVMES